MTSTALPTCQEFKILRDEFKRQRWLSIYPSLRGQYDALNANVEGLRKQITDMGIRKTKDLSYKDLLPALQHNHKRERLYSEMIELTWELQALHGQIAVIEGDLMAKSQQVADAA